MADNNTTTEPKKIEASEGVVDSGGTVVGLSKTKKIGIAVVMVVTTIIAVYFVVVPSEEEKGKKGKPKKEAIERALKSANNAATQATPEEERPGLPLQLPELPTLAIPEPPKPPAPPPSAGPEEAFNPFDFGRKPTEAPKEGKEGAPPLAPPMPQVGIPAPPAPPPLAVPAPEPIGGLSDKQRQERRAGSIFAFGGAAKSGEKEGKLPAKANVALTSPLERTSAAQVKNSYYGDKNYMILQGKMIEIVLETAINTDLKGLLRGVVSRDVFAESGRNILIPAGSRAIGTYSASLESGQSRVAVVWTRIIRPDGIDVVLEMPATDRLGRSGVSGEVDYHFPEIMRNSLLLSLLTIASGVILTEIFDNNVVTQTVDTTTGSVTTASSAAYVETQGVMNDVLGDLRTSLDKTEKTTQTISVNSGTVVKAFVRQDIVFVGDTAFAYDGS
jgi:type IV secretion system protein VirB10